MSRFMVPTTESSFGPCLDLAEVLPEGCDLVLLCKMTSAGYVPAKVLLPHQVYTADLAGGEWVIFALGEPVVVNEGTR